MSPLPIATGVYRWEDAIHQTTEARAFLRSRRALLDRLTRYVLARHPYEVPNITALPIVGGNPEYLAWISSETSYQLRSTFVHGGRLHGLDVPGARGALAPIDMGHRELHDQAVARIAILIWLLSDHALDSPSE